MSAFFERNGPLLGSYLIVAVGFWILVLILLPQLAMLDISFRYNLPPSLVGSERDVYTLSNYQHMLFGNPGNPDRLAILGYQTDMPINKIDLAVFAKTIFVAVCITVFDLILCYPLAYYLGQSRTGGSARIFVLLLIIPYWVNEILRAFAFRIIFGTSGVINTALLGLGVIDQPYDFIRENIALYAGLGYAYILLMIFPIYNAIESLDHNQVEAARDLGSPWWRIHWRVVIPFAKPGITSGCTMVFMLTAGALAAPQILGGPSSLWFTQIIYQWFNTGQNWARGSAYAVVLLITCIIFVLFMMRAFKVKMGEIGK
ncbi:MAG: ABC transporter permease [Alphaproteobacteria bacterium]|nr:ABC transporter permease [Alphaproteobacteria bacterium]